MRRERLYQFIFFLAIFVFWELGIRVFNVPNYLLPSPTEIIAVITKNYTLILQHFERTLFEVGVGLGMGLSAAVVLSVLAVRSRPCEIVLYPLVVTLQTIPKVAIAPLLLIWLGFGIGPKIVISGLMCFFPIFINLTKGLKSLDPDLGDLLTVYKANTREILFKAKLPNAMPDFFAGLKAAVPLSVIGAIVGEFVGANQGIGYLIMQAQAGLEIAMVFASIAFLSFIGVVLFAIVRFIEKRAIFWHVSEEKKFDTKLT
jgi:NitT/TauT family transport system permease protein